MLNPMSHVCNYAHALSLPCSLVFLSLLSSLTMVSASRRFATSPGSLIHTPLCLLRCWHG